MTVPKIDLFSFPHQEQRNAMFDISRKLGLHGQGGEGKFEDLLDKLQEVIELIKDHSDTENTFIDPILVAHGIEVEGWPEPEHEELEKMLHELESMISKGRGGTAEQQLEYCPQIYSALNRFIAHYLLHIDKEEQEIMHLMWDKCDAAEIAGIMVAFAVSKQAAIAKEYVPPLLNDMTADEQERMYNSIKKQAPDAAYTASLEYKVDRKAS